MLNIPSTGLSLRSEEQSSTCSQYSITKLRASPEGAEGLHVRAVDAAENMGFYSEKQPKKCVEESDKDANRWL